MICKGAPDEDPNITSLQDDDAVKVEVGDKKSLLANAPKSRAKDIDSRLNDVVEIGIAREMMEANKKHVKKGHHRSKTLHGKNRSKTSRSKIPLKKIILKHKKAKSSKNAAKRVEIEDGFKSDTSPFSNLKEVENGVDKVDLQTAVLGSEAEFKTNMFDGLNRDLPDFGGLDNVGDVEKLLETPKPKKKMDYYVDHFSSDPYEAESEKEQWLQENSIRSKEYRREVKEKDDQGINKLLKPKIYIKCLCQYPRLRIVRIAVLLFYFVSLFVSLCLFFFLFCSFCFACLFVCFCELFCLFCLL